MAFPKGKKHSTETKQKMRKTHLALGTRPPSWLGKKHSEETKKKIGLNQPPHTAEHLAKIIARNKNPLFWTKEIRRRASEAGKKKILNEEALKITHKKNKGKKRTVAQRIRISLSLRGAKSSFWKGGITPKTQKERSSARLARWRLKIFERDNWTCQDCKVRGGKLQAHHIRPFAYYPKLRFRLSNGITLCLKCHRKTDSYGHKAHQYARN